MYDRRAQAPSNNQAAVPRAGAANGRARLSGAGAAANRVLLRLLVRSQPVSRARTARTGCTPRLSQSARALRRPCVLHRVEGRRRRSAAFAARLLRRAAGCAHSGCGRALGRGRATVPLLRMRGADAKPQERRMTRDELIARIGEAYETYRRLPDPDRRYRVTSMSSWPLFVRDAVEAY